MASAAKQIDPLAMTLAKSDRGAVIAIQATAAMLGILPCRNFFIAFQRTLNSDINMGAVKYKLRCYGNPIR